MPPAPQTILAVNGADHAPARPQTSPGSGLHARANKPGSVAPFRSGVPQGRTPSTTSAPAPAEVLDLHRSVHTYAKLIARPGCRQRK